MEEDNNRLKDIVKNKLILEEEVFDLKTRLVNFKEQEKKLSNLQVDLSNFSKILLVIVYIFLGQTSAD